MKATLNLHFDKSTIEAAEAYARKKQTSVSEIIEAYLKKLINKEKPKNEFVYDSLIGVLKKYKHYTDDKIKVIYLKEKHNA